MASQMIDLPVLLTAEKLQTNKSNYPTFKVLIEEHAASKGLSGYLDGCITKPPLVTSPPGITPPNPTPVFSTTPSREEYIYRDSVMKSMIVTNLIDPIVVGSPQPPVRTQCFGTSSFSPKRDSKKDRTTHLQKMRARHLPALRKSDFQLGFTDGTLVAVWRGGSTREDDGRGQGAMPKNTKFVFLVSIASIVARFMAIEFTGFEAL
ncbi:hypothetical protein B0H14DRAFT_2631728 [Mycena olivaceomarginata]|nr:hypothetical protein B0H14DRAFT_2631728 [Mycena olivaceomarginata]